MWHKWDLHVHSSYSYDYKDKSVNAHRLADEINRSDIDAVAITDHWTIEGFFEIKKHISNSKLLIPGIELRIDKSSKQKILSKKPPNSSGTGLLHAIVIFPETTKKEEIEINFLHQVELCEDKNKHITRFDFISLGKSIGREGLSEDEYYKIGCQQAYVDLKIVRKCADALNGLVILTYDKYGGFENIDPINDSVLKTNLVKDADLIETSKENVRESFYNNEKILKSCGKKTPCVKGSDSHSLKEIGRDFTWIKSAKSFEGLRQILYFPKERVSFDTNKPSCSYPRIESIQLEKINISSFLTGLNQEINLNENLSSIIGHPSIGKSTIAELIAYLFDNHTNEIIGESKTKIKNISELSKDLQITAKVKVGTVSNVIKRNVSGKWEGDITPEEFKITYLNQGYIDRTARDPKAVSTLIENKIDTTRLDLIKDKIIKTKARLNKDRDTYLKKFVIQKEKEEIESKLQNAKKFFDISASPAYQKLIRDLKSVNSEHEQRIKTKENISSIAEVLSEIKEQFTDIEFDEEKIKSLFPSLSKLVLPTKKELFETPLEKANNLLSNLENSKEIKEYEKKQSKIYSEIEQLFIKENITYSQKILKKKNDEQVDLGKQLRNRDSLLEVAEKAKKDFQSQISELTQDLTTWSKLNDKVLLEFNEGLSNVEVKYEGVDQRAWLIDVLTIEVKDIWDKFTPIEQRGQKFIKPSKEDIDKFLSTFEKNLSIPEIILHLLASLKKNIIPSNIEHEYLKWLFGDYSEVIKEYLKLRLQEFAEEGMRQIYFNGKNISKEGMSFTERCGALLELILEKGEEPLILDQPEENVGATYITRTLIDKILRKKTERQIIIISHNPNMVVLADSDLVVAFDKDESKKDSIVLKAGAIESPGIREAICDIIEGGEEAFGTRAKRYKVFSA